MKDKISSNILKYDEYVFSLFNNLEYFINNIEPSDDFNFTYLNLVILCKEYKECFFEYMRIEINDFWIGNPDSYRSFKLFGLSENQLEDLEIKNQHYFLNNVDIWSKKIQKKFFEEYKYLDFQLFVENKSLKGVKGNWNKDMVKALNYQVYNTDGWEVFIKEVALMELNFFKIKNKKELLFFKDFYNYELIIEINPCDILDVNKLLNKNGFFDFGVNIFFQNKYDVNLKIYPPELNILNLFIYDNYIGEFKNAQSENAKIRIFANLLSLFKLFNFLSPSFDMLASILDTEID